MMLPAIQRMKNASGQRRVAQYARSKPQNWIKSSHVKGQPRPQERQDRFHTTAVQLFLLFLLSSLFGPARAKMARHDKLSPGIGVIPVEITDIGPENVVSRTTKPQDSHLPEEGQLDWYGPHTDIFQVQDYTNNNFDSYSDYEIGLTNIYVKGRLQNSFNFWKNIGASDFILNVIKDGYKIPLKSEPDSVILNNNKSAAKHEKFVDTPIEDLLISGSIKYVSERPHVVNPLTVSVNAKGKERLILDLRHVNEHVLLNKIKFEDVKTVSQYITSECFGFIFDLKNGYHHLDVCISYRKYLGFQWKGKFYIFTVLPFGLRTSGYIFTKVIRPLVKKWRKEGIKVVVYLDDGFGVSDNTETCILHSERVRSDLIASGFVPNKDKCNWTPSQDINWLGFHWDLKAGKLSVPSRKLDDIDQLLSYLIQAGSRVKIRDLARFCGKVISLKPAVGTVTQIMTRNIFSVINNRTHWDQYVNIVAIQGCIEELRYWKQNIFVLKSTDLF